MFWFYAPCIKAVLWQTQNNVKQSLRNRDDEAATPHSLMMKKRPLMVTRIGQDPLLWRRTKIPHSCQNTAGFCWLPPSGSCPALTDARDQGLVPQPSWPPCAGVFFARRQHQWRDPVQTVQPSVAQGHGGWGGIFQQPLLPTAEGIVAAGVKAVLTAPIPLARGAGCLGWRGDRGGGEGETAERGWHCWQKAKRSRKKLHVGLSLQCSWLFHALPAWFQFYFFYPLNPWFHRLHGLFHTL